MPRWVREQQQALARRTGDGDKTEGVLLVNREPLRDSTFTVNDRGAFRSGKHNKYTAGEGLAMPYRRLTTVLDHVEGHAAAIMRRSDGPREASLLLNNRPCNDPSQAFQCEWDLPKILPKGAKLSVYVTDGDRTWLHKTYTGTGEWIKK